jgi:hypothetical protein
LTDACDLAWDDLHDPSSGGHADDPPPRKWGKASDPIDPAR